MRHLPRNLAVCTGLGLALAGCDRPVDSDLRGAFGDAPSTTQAARAAEAGRPEPDERGIISYPGYQVAVARRGDTLARLATRIGADARELARYNGIQTGDPLRAGEIVALPSRVPEPAGGPIKSPDGVDIDSLAGEAIRRADRQQVETSRLEPSKPRTGVEPVRHKVERGETAFSIARLYDVPIRTLAEWNGLGPDFSVREGQFLLIPAANTPRDAGRETETTGDVAPPGSGSPSPTPPSASKPLPEEDTQPASAPTEAVAAPDLGADQGREGASRMVVPVEGDIVRDYAKGRNDGIDIAATPGRAVNAADAGTVAAITEDTNGVPIIVIKHDGNLLTVYSNVAGVAVEKGDTVSRGQKIAEIRRDGSAVLHFEVRDGFDSVDPGRYLNPS
ncbi:peptidoglycan DD-metalloendopeptidase family protein [Roseovarius sp. D22-M7]